jgi:hypothetical protein
MDIQRALMSIRPGAAWSLNGETYEGLHWLEKPAYEGGQKKPTKEEVESEVSRLQQEWEITQYQRDRKKEYPDITEYLDGVVKGDDAQIQAYIDKCNAVKAKYPKPEGA